MGWGSSWAKILVPTQANAVFADLARRGIHALRQADPVGLERSDDFARQWFLQWGGAEAGIHDYSVGGVREGEWLEYTRTVGAQAFKVRLRQWVEDLPLHNFLVFIPVENPGRLRPLIAEVRPWPGETVLAGDHAIGAVMVDRDTAVNVGTIELKLDGLQVEAMVQPGEGMVTVTYPVTGLGRGSTHQVELRFTDSLGAVQTEIWSYLVSGDGVPRLESATDVVGPYAGEVSAVVDLEAQTIRVAAPSQPRF